MILIGSNDRKNRPDNISDDLFGGRASPALMSDKEPAIQKLRKRYSESFAITKGSGHRIHLFLIKLGLWSVVWTFTPRDLGENLERITVEQTLKLIDDEMNAQNSLFVSKLDASVSKALNRIEKKAREFSLR